MSGVAVLDDMILVSTCVSSASKDYRWTRPSTRSAITRLRPVLMTTLVASLGFLPMAFSHGMGAEVQRPLATVVIGGVLGAMVMSLLVLRVLYLVFAGSVVRGDSTESDDEDRGDQPEAAHLPWRRVEFSTVEDD